MIEKSFRLSNGFWHKFFPNSNKLFSPFNIPLEIWDIDARAKESKWNTGIYGIKNIAFSSKGDRFVIYGGWTTANPLKNEFKIYETDSFNCIDEFCLMEEKCTNPKFTCEDKTLVFGTWEGNIYGYCLETKKIVKQFSLENHVFGLAHSGKYDDYLYFKTTKIPDENSNYALDYIFEYDAMKKNGSKVTFTEKINPYEIHGITGSGLKGLALFKEKLAITTAYYGKSEEENGRLIGEAKTYVFDILSKRVTLIKDSYKIRSLFDNFSCIVWNNKGNKLAFIGLHEVYIIDTYNNSEVIIPFDGATSVEFSNCDTGIAVGGDKAKLFKIE